jgi:hypothetical protein
MMWVWGVISHLSIREDVMRLEELLGRFQKESPIAVMARATLDHLVSNDRLNDLFEKHAVQQKCGELLFSTVADLMALVAIKAKPSVHAAYKHRTADRVGVAVASIYYKLQGLEPSVGRALVAETGQEIGKVLSFMKAGLPMPVIEGFQTRIIDANHFAGTEHRIKELRGLGAAALPGQCIPILDPDRRLMVDVIPCEDGHAGECTMIPEILELVQPGQCWIGDRRYGTKTMIMAIAIDKKSHFIFRHALGNIPEWETSGPKVKIGKYEGDTIYEQPIVIEFKGQRLELRRITINLVKPTRDGDTEIHLLTNLPARIKARQVAHAYRKRWKIETAFQQMAESLNCEIETLGYPKAALFSFCMGLMMFNLLSLIKTAIAAWHQKPELAENLSTYFIALEISESWSGFRIAISDSEFHKLEGKQTASSLARRLISISKDVNLKRMLKSTRGPKKPPPTRKSGNRGNHVATSRILAANREKS